MKKILMILTAVILAVSASVALFAVGAEYTDSDPLVTLSYINETVIPKITEDVKNAVLAFLEDKEEEVPEEPVQPIEPEITEPEVPPITEETLLPLKYAVVFLKNGEKLMATGKETSSTEIILRAGSVAAISPFDDQGIADLTSSKELYNNDLLTKNNYCIIPRGSDGRGITAVNGDAYILVRGEYEIVQQQEN